MEPALQNWINQASQKQEAKITRQQKSSLEAEN
jgi:hypothetical protein